MWDEEDGVGVFDAVEASLGEPVNVVSVGALPHKPVRATHEWVIAFGLSGYFVDVKVCMLLVALWDGVGEEGYGWDVHVLVDRHAVRGVGALT